MMCNELTVGYHKEDTTSHRKSSVVKALFATHCSSDRVPMSAFLDPLEPLGDEELLDFVLEAEYKQPGDVSLKLETRETPADSKTKQIKAQDQKREKSRARERRKYYRKKEKFVELQQQMELLERQLQQVTAQAGNRAISSFAVPRTSLEADSNEPFTTRDELRTHLLELTQTRAILRNENTQLRKQLREASLRKEYLCDLLYGEHKLYCAHASYFRLLTPLSREACYQIHAHSSATVSSFSRAMVKAAETGMVAGWRAKRFADGNLFKFTIEKKFHRTNAKAACAQVWSVLLDPLRSKKISAQELGKLVRLVQKVCVLGRTSCAGTRLERRDDQIRIAKV